MDFAIIIPVYNEGRNLEPVLKTASLAKQLDQRIAQIIVVDDGSQDDTAAVAQGYPITLVQLSENKGKGAAMAAGVQACTTAGLLFIDGDLIDLEPIHLHNLIDPVDQGKARMTLGIFGSGRIATDLAQTIAPDITGQRAMRKDDFLLVQGLETSKYGVDIALTNYAKKMGWKIEKVAVKGVTQIMKEEKYGLIKGAQARFRMYVDILKKFRA